MKLVDEWQRYWKAASVWVGTAWALVLATGINYAGLLGAFWNQLPSEVQAIFPAPVRIGIIVIAAAASIFAARVKKQESLTP